MTGDATRRGPLLVAYDGSAGSRRSVEVASNLFPGATIVIVHVREPAGPIAPPVAGPAAPLVVPPDREELEESERRARRVLDEGARLARDLGLRAETHTSVGAGAAGVAQQILEAADEHGASAIVIGSRGRPALLAALIGSVSDGVVHQARRPVLVVPHDE